MFGFLTIAVLVGLAYLLLPCPDPDPPPGLPGQFLQSWSTVIFVFCTIYAFIPAGSFQFWSFWLPVGYAIASALCLSYFGFSGHALFLCIELGLALIYISLLNLAYTLVLEAEGRPSWSFRLLIGITGALFAPTLAYANAVHFSGMVCWT